MSTDGLTAAYSTTTGRKMRVPAHYFDHPTLGRNLRRTPSAAAALAAEPPRDSWTKDRITAWAAEHGVDLGDAGTKAEMVAAIEEAAEADQQNQHDDAGHQTGDDSTPDGTAPSDQTPA